MTAPVPAVNGALTPEDHRQAPRKPTPRTYLTLSAVPEVGPVCRRHSTGVRPPSADDQTYVDERDPLTAELLRELLPYADWSEAEKAYAWGDR